MFSPALCRWGEWQSLAIKEKSKEWVRVQKGFGVPWSPCPHCRMLLSIPLPLHTSLSRHPLSRHAPKALLEPNGDFFADLLNY